MIISIIVAKGKNNQIGLNNSLPWKVGDDLKNFKKLTLDHHILMGRKTFDSIGHALPKRTNIVITRNSDFKPKDCFIFDCSYKAIDFARQNGETELFVCGGVTIYKFFIENDLADKIYMTNIDYEGEGDSFFPELDITKWKILRKNHFDKNDYNEYSGDFVELERMR